MKNFRKSTIDPFQNGDKIDNVPKHFNKLQKYSISNETNKDEILDKEELSNKDANISTKTEEGYNIKCELEKENISEKKGGRGYMYPALKNYIKRSKKKPKKNSKKNTKKNSKKMSKKKSIKARRRNKKSKKSRKRINK